MSDLLGGIFSGIGSIASALIGKNYNEEMNRKQVDLMYESWAREDNAVQRRVQDLEAAGLNKLLAVGSQAQSSSPVTLQRRNPMEDAQIAMNMLKQKQDVSLSKAQQELDIANADLAKEKKNTELLNQGKLYQDTLTSRANQESTMFRKTMEQNEYGRFLKNALPGTLYKDNNSIIRLGNVIVSALGDLMPKSRRQSVKDWLTTVPSEERTKVESALDQLYTDKSYEGKTMEQLMKELNVPDWIKGD